MRERPRIHQADRFTVVRFDDGAVVLDPATSSVFELLDEAADAFCLLYDLEVVAPASERAARQTRKVVRGLRREMFGEAAFGPNESVGVDGENGELLFRRYPEPPAWRLPRRKSAMELEGGVVRVGTGLILLVGSAGGRSAVARVFSAAGYDAVGHDGLVIEPERRVLSSAWREGLVAVEAWIVELGGRPPLRVARQRSACALAKLLAATQSRPEGPTLDELSRFAADVAMFGIQAPGDGEEAARTIGAYHELRIP